LKTPQESKLRRQGPYVVLSDSEDSDCEIVPDLDCVCNAFSLPFSSSYPPSLPTLHLFLPSISSYPPSLPTLHLFLPSISSYPPSLLAIQFTSRPVNRSMRYHACNTVRLKLLTAQRLGCDPIAWPATVPVLRRRHHRGLRVGGCSGVWML